MNRVTPSAALPLLILSFSPALPAQSSHTQIPPRLAEEAEVLLFRMPPAFLSAKLSCNDLSCLRPASAGAPAPPPHDSAGPQLQVREPVQSDDRALSALSQHIQQGDDRTRKRMLQQFTRDGLVDIASRSSSSPPLPPSPSGLSK